jgi:hypothetical protein
MFSACSCSQECQPVNFLYWLFRLRLFQTFVSYCREWLFREHSKNILADVGIFGIDRRTFRMKLSINKWKQVHSTRGIIGCVKTPRQRSGSGLCWGPVWRLDVGCMLSVMRCWDRQNGKDETSVLEGSNCASRRSSARQVPSTEELFS